MENDCLGKEPKDYAFQFIGPDVQFYLRRGMHWNDCFLLIMSGSKITKIKPEAVDCKTDSDLKKMFCQLFTLADDNNITLKSIRKQDINQQLRDYIQKMEGEK